LLYKIRGQGYVLNLNISSQVEDLQEILLFDYAAEILEKNGLIHPPDDERLRQLMERGQQGVTKSRVSDTLITLKCINEFQVDS